MDLHQLLAQWNNTKVPFPHDSLLQEVFEEQVHRSPQALAVIFENEQLTYSELNNRSHQLAHHLQKLGIKPEIPVGIYMERSPELIIAIFGILKAGGVCVPLDPSYPQEQLNFVLTDTGLTIVLTQNKFLKNLSNKTLTLIAMDSWGGPNWLEISTPRDTCLSKNLAFIFYTSGSTGNPKGVMLSHRAVHSHIFWRKKAFDLTSDDKHLFRASIGFAFLLTEVFTPLLTGGAIVIVRPGAHQDNAYLLNLIAERKVTIVNLVPSQIRVLLEEQDFDKCKSLRHCVTGGESLPLWLQKRFFSRLNVGLSIIYGSTEARSTTFWQCDPHDERLATPIGRAAPNKQIYLVDDAFQLVPVGEPGEICVAGEGLARGYLGRPDLTAEKFVTNPFSENPDDRMYRTGDFARYLPDGTLEFLGRRDQQVKVRGYRVELGQVEAAIAQHSSTREVVVITKDDSSGNKYVVAYVASDQADTFTAAVLKAFLKDRLPEYMVPAFIHVLKALPLTPNEKVDFQELAAQTQRHKQQDSISPRNHVEHVLADIWSELFGHTQIGIYDNFFELGGDSLLATQVISRIREQLKTDLPLQIIFEKPVLAELSSAIITAKA